MIKIDIRKSGDIFKDIEKSIEKYVEKRALQLKHDKEKELRLVGPLKPNDAIMKAVTQNPHRQIESMIKPLNSTAHQFGAATPGTLMSKVQQLGKPIVSVIVTYTSKPGYKKIY